MLKHLGLISIITLSLGLLFVVKRWRYGIDRTFSQHIARSKHAIVFYIALFGITLPMLLLFFLGWFIPHFDLSIWFTVFVIAAAFLQFSCTLVPEVGGKKSKVHRAMAFLSADFLLPATVILATGSSISFSGRLTAALSATIMALIILIMLKNKAEHKYLLLLQSAYFFVFFLSIIVVTYSS